jgi:ATP-dependent helicase/nuclease subunit A
MSDFTPQQLAAINGQGNLLLVAGAGTGKTHTLVERCLRFVIEERVSLENILMVTFTEAAAAEMRARIRGALQQRQAARPDDEHLAQQLALLDTARICTMHSFCLQLAREHFHELGLDPQFTVLDEPQTHPLVRAVFDELLEEHYSRSDAAAQAVQSLVRTFGRGVDDPVRTLVWKLHVHSQSLPDPAGWLEKQQVRLEQVEPGEWRQWFLEAVSTWRKEFLETLAAQSSGVCAVRLSLEALRDLPAPLDLDAAANVLRAVEAADQPGHWPHGTKGTIRKPLREFFEGGQFLASLLPDGEGNDPLAQDWEWTRPHLNALVSLTREFTARFTAAKRELAGVDFADLEQCALQLLRQPAIAAAWRGRFEQVLVDEYQDINAAQDAILTALSRGGEAANRFMVGDVKQSIYRFRLANPKIFGGYDERWSQTGAEGTRIPLTGNFRSREGLLNFVNPFFAAFMRPEVGGVKYEALEFGASFERSPLAAKPGEEPCVEFHLIARADEEHPPDGHETEAEPAKAISDLLAIEREARLVARRLRELKENGFLIWVKDQQRFRKVEWSDMAVLLRSPSGRAEAFAKEFSKAGVPLIAARDGFFASLEVSDLLNLLRLLDNPLQDVPLAAVLRSPLVGLSLEELAGLRVHNPARPLWTALARFHEVENAKRKTQSPKPEVSNQEPKVQKPELGEGTLHEKLSLFLDQYHRWRELVRQTSLSRCLETALLETHYEAILRAGARGPERTANVRRLLDLARQFDPYQRQGLYRFLRFVEAQEEEELDLQPESTPGEAAVRLISIHRSKGLEFPIVALAGLGTRFNERDLHGQILLSERYGLCPRITPPDREHSYPSVPYWLAWRAERFELRGEELRLLYVAMTRARDRLILAGTTNRKAGDVRWTSNPHTAVSTTELAGARSPLDWLLMWLPRASADSEWQEDRRGKNARLQWQIYEGQDEIARQPMVESEVSSLQSKVAEGGATTLDSRLQTLDSSANGVAASVEAVKARVSKPYPFDEATRSAAKTSVSAIRRQAAEEWAEESKRVFGARERTVAPRRLPIEAAKLSAAERGSIHHRFLQLVSLERTGSEAELIAEAKQILQAGRMSPGEVAALDFSAIATFWRSDLGQRVRAEAKCVRRELAFTARFRPGELAAITREPSLVSDEDFIVVQGVADLVVLRPNDIWLVDFKTDVVASSEVASKARLYEPQLKLYSLALKRIFGRPVTASWLHFLSVPQTVQMTPAAGRYEQGELF